MTKPTPKPDDPVQSERFNQLVEQLAKDGMLEPDPAEKLDKLVKRVLPVKLKKPSGSV